MPKEEHNGFIEDGQERLEEAYRMRVIEELNAKYQSRIDTAPLPLKWFLKFQRSKELEKRLADLAPYDANY